MPAQRPRLRALLISAAHAAGLYAGQTAAIGAQERAPEPLETITVTGSRLTSTRFANGTTFDRVTIATRDKPSVPLLLADVPGVQTTLPGGRGSVGEVLIRGAEPNFSTVLVNGVQMNDPTNTRGGSFDFATLATDEIETIEVLSGPLSSIYGSDALGGVINVITRAPSDRFGVGGTAAAGDDAYARYAARITGPITRRSAYSAGATSFRDGHADASASARVESVNASFEIEGRNEVEGLAVHARRSEASFGAYPDSSGGPLLAVIPERERRDAVDSTLGASWRSALTGRHRLTVNLSALEHDEVVDSPGVAPGPGGAIPPNRSRTEFSRETLTAYVNSVFGDAIEAAYGLSVERQAGASEGALELAPGTEIPTGYALDRDNAALFFEFGLPVSDTLRLEAALRIDDSDVAERVTTHRVNLSQRLGEGRVRVHITAAEAYKLPSLFALGDPLTGNPALRPETAESWEVGIDVGNAATSSAVGLAVFAQRFDDLIDFDFDSFSSVNRDRVETHGLEVQGRHQLTERLTLLGSATWLDIDVVGTDTQLRLRPERYASLGATWVPAPSWSVYTSARYVDSRLDTAIPTGDRRLPSYTRLDVAVRWQLSPALSLGLAIDDLGDRRFEDAIGFPGLGRRYRLSLSGDLPAS